MRDKEAGVTRARRCGPAGILALDIATTTGWAYGQIGADPVWGSERMGGEGACAAAIFTTFDAWLRHFLDGLAPKIVYAEMPYISTKMPLAAERLYGFRALTEVRCFAADRDGPHWVPPAKITKLFTGLGQWPGGRVEKKTATIRVCAQYGWQGLSDDEADALALFVYGEHQIDANAAQQRLNNAQMTPNAPYGRAAAALA